MTATTPHFEVRTATMADPLVRPLLEELEYEYTTRYPSLAGASRNWSATRRRSSNRPAAGC